MPHLYIQANVNNESLSVIIVSPFEGISVLIVFIDTFEQMLQNSYCTDSETVLFHFLSQ